MTQHDPELRPSAHQLLQLLPPKMEEQHLKTGDKLFIWLFVCFLLLLLLFVSFCFFLFA
jgi:hypothetical protein